MKLQYDSTAFLTVPPPFLTVPSFSSRFPNGFILCLFGGKVDLKAFRKCIIKHSQNIFKFILNRRARFRFQTLVTCDAGNHARFLIYR